MRPINGFAPADVFLGTVDGRRLALDEGRRARHVHVIGSPGTGKSKALEYWIRQDILAGRGLCLLDPHGYLYDDLIAWCAGRILLDRKRIILLDASSEDWSFGFNPLRFESNAPQEIARAVDAMIKACAQVWGGEDTARTPLLRRCLRAIFHVLAEQDLTLTETVPLMSAQDPSGLRRFLTRSIRHPLFAAQWEDFNSMRPREYQDTFSSTNNRLIEFLHSPVIERIVGQRESVVDFGKLMDDGAIVLVKLGGSSLSPDSAHLLGALIVNEFFSKATRRPPGSRPFRVYVDECHRFLNDDVARILNEGRKFGLHLVLAHQNLGQLREAGEGVFRAVFGMAKTKVVFGGLDPEDAELMARSLFAGEFDYEEVKKGFLKPSVVGYRRVRLANASKTETSAQTSGTTTTESDGWTEGQGWDGEDNEVEDSRFSTSTRGQSSRGESSSATDSTSVSVGYSESLEPILKDLPSSGYSLVELRDRSAARLMNLPDRTAIVKLPGRSTIEVTIPNLEPAHCSDARAARFVTGIMEATDCARPVALVDEEVTARKTLLLAQAEAYAHPREPERFRR